MWLRWWLGKRMPRGMHALEPLWWTGFFVNTRSRQLGYIIFYMVMILAELKVSNDHSCGELLSKDFRLTVDPWDEGCQHYSSISAIDALRPQISEEVLSIGCWVVVSAVIRRRRSDEQGVVCGSCFRWYHVAQCGRSVNELVCSNPTVSANHL